MSSSTSNPFRVTVREAARDALESLRISRKEKKEEYLFCVENIRTRHTAQLSLKLRNVADVIDFILQLKRFCPAAHYVTYQRVYSKLEPDNTVPF